MFAVVESFFRSKAMLAFAWLRKGAAGVEQKTVWQKDTPLPASDGGSVGILTPDNFLAAADSLRNGGKMIGLITLHQVSNDFSYPGIKFQNNRLETLARKLFSTNKQSGNNIGGLTPNPAGGLTPPADKFYETSDPSFPLSWPGTLPIIVRDISKPPIRWKLLAADEMVAAYWKMVDFIARAIPHHEARAKAEPEGSPNLKAIVDKVELYTKQLAVARKLARNVTAEVIFASTDQEALDKSLTYRESFDDMAEFLGLTGCNRIAVIGGRRDSLRHAGQPCSPADVAKALQKVVWSSGREVTAAVASKCLAIWDRLANLPEAIEVVMAGQSYYGQSSPYEDWSKLSLILGMCHSNAQLIWVMQTILAERVHGKRDDNYSNAELGKKGSPVQVMMLRSKLVSGILLTFFQTSIDSLGILASARPELKPELDALKACRSTFATVTSYYQHGRAQQADQPVSKNTDAWLPKWAAGPARRVLRACHDGRKDGVLLGLCVSPPKGGVSALKYEDIVSAQDLQDDIEEIKKGHDVWLAEREGRTHSQRLPTQGWPEGRREQGRRCDGRPGNRHGRCPQPSAGARRSCQGDPLCACLLDCHARDGAGMCELGQVRTMLSLPAAEV